MNYRIKKIFFLVLLYSPLLALKPLQLSDHKDYLAIRKHPYMRAFLDTIAYAEGNLNPYGYWSRYPGTSFTSFKDHPRIRQCAPYNGQPLCSTAAGRYMFVVKTWDNLVPVIQATNFSPLNQDKGAIQLIYQAGALGDVVQGRFYRAIYKLNKIWATLPGAPFGQPTKTESELRKIYDQRLRFYLSRKKF